MSSQEKKKFTGEYLYGDDFSSQEVELWFKDEAEAYAKLGAKNKDTYKYSYHELNKLHGFRFIISNSSNKFIKFKALWLGSAYGIEFFPIISHLDSIIIMDPSSAFNTRREIFGVPCKYSKPSPSGQIPFSADSFDLIMSLGVLHHIPNVSYVISECYRCLSESGVMLVREPIVSMGDWRYPRPGLTKRERGIPIKVFDSIISNIGFNVQHKSLCVFPLIPKLANKFGIHAYNNRILTLIDAFLSKLFSWNTKYHRTSYVEKIGPASVFYVLSKNRQYIQ